MATHHHNDRPVSDLTHYATLLADIKSRIQAAQTRAVLSVNAEMIRLYWNIGRLLDERQALQGWGAAVIPRLANDLRNELPEVKGFSVRNLDRMLAFARAYPEPGEFSPQAVAKSLSGEVVHTQRIPRELSISDKRQFGNTRPPIAIRISSAFLKPHPPPAPILGMGAAT